MRVPATKPVPCTCIVSLSGARSSGIDLGSTEAISSGGGGALINAVAIYKTIRSKNPTSGAREHLHIIQSPNFAGVAIYTKGKLTTEHGLDTYYLLVSSKRAL